MRWWINSKAWITLLVFSLTSSALGILYLPDYLQNNASSVKNVTNGSFNQSNSSQPSATSLSPPANQQSDDDAFQFPIHNGNPSTLITSDTELHVISVYKGDDGKPDIPWWKKCGDPLQMSKQKTFECHQKFASLKIERPVTVSAQLSQPSVLVLTAYEPVSWTIRTHQPEHIRKIILAGYHAQQIKSMPPAIPVDIATHYSSPACSTCTQTKAIPFAREKTDRNFPSMLNELRKRTGLELSTFQSTQQAGQFSLSSATPRLRYVSSSPSDRLTEHALSERTYSDYVELLNTKIPLPAGIWESLAYHQISKDYGNDQAFVFYQKTDGQLTQLLAIRLTFSKDGKGFPANKACEYKDGYEQVTDNNEPYGLQQCYWLDYVTNPWQSPLFSLVANRISNKKLKLPPLVINRGSHLANTDHSLTFYHYVNPEVAGITTQTGSRHASPWSPRKLDSDAERQAYVEKQLDEMFTWYQFLKAWKP